VAARPVRAWGSKIKFIPSKGSKIKFIPSKGSKTNLFPAGMLKKIISGEIPFIPSFPRR
jgi:hypothetical protein